ncbi:hypothetical protein ACJX0J_025208 [Zea mays]
MHQRRRKKLGTNSDTETETGHKFSLRSSKTVGDYVTGHWALRSSKTVGDQILSSKTVGDQILLILVENKEITRRLKHKENINFGKFVSGILFLEFWALFLFLGAHTQFWALILAQFWALFLCNKDIDRVKIDDTQSKTYLWQGDLKYELVNLFTLKQQMKNNLPNKLELFSISFER